MSAIESMIPQPTRGAHNEAYVRELWRWLNERVTYQSDQKTYGEVEHWASLVPELEKGHTNLKGDCEDFALTMAELMMVAGWARHDLLIVRVKTAQAPRSASVDHVVLWAALNDWHLCCDCWLPREVYRVGSRNAPDHKAVDYQCLPIRPRGWKLILHTQAEKQGKSL